MMRSRFLGVAVMAELAAAVAVAQTVPAPPYYAMSPSSPVTPRAEGPVQQQVLENYRSQLLQTQRDMLLQNPSGVGAGPMGVGRQLNNLGTGSLAATPPSSALIPAPSLNTVPSTGVAPR